MRFVYLGPPDEPEVWETHAFGQDWVKGQPADAGDPEAVARLLRHPHWATEGDAALDLGVAVRVAPPGEHDADDGQAEAWAAEINGDVPAPKRRGRPRKDAA